MFKKIKTDKKSSASDFILIKTESRSRRDLSSHESILLNGLFKDSKNSVKLSDLDTFYKDVKNSGEALRRQIASLDYFEKSIYNL